MVNTLTNPPATPANTVTFLKLQPRHLVQLSLICKVHLLQLLETLQKKRKKHQGSDGYHFF